tara:strand:+ start:1279 stop:1491 length:213 start_codon:yes stop_codon:yes gene_type:complete
VKKEETNQQTNEENHSTFDKFITDITNREEEHRQRLREYAESHDDSPQREYNRLYRERPQNRVRWNTGKK